MKPDMFEKPVTILLGLGIPTEVKSVMQAYQILMDWRTPQIIRPSWRSRRARPRSTAKSRRRRPGRFLSLLPKRTICLRRKSAVS